MCTETERTGKKKSVVERKQGKRCKDDESCEEIWQMLERSRELVKKEKKVAMD